MASRRTANTGSVYQRADGYWCAAITLPSAGARRRKVIVRKTKADAMSALRQATKELADAGDLPTATPTVSQWLDLWWDRYVMLRLKVTARRSYRTAVERYIKPAIGRTRLDKLNVDHIYRMHAYVTGEKGLSPTTALMAHNVLSSALDDAVREGRVNRNVASVAAKPRKAAHKATWLSSAQARDLLVAAPEARWALALLTGMRQGERLGLTHGAIDLEKQQIVVSWQLQRIPFEHGCGKATGDVWPCGKKRAGYCPARTLTIPADQEVRPIEGSAYLVRPKTKAGWRLVPMVGPLAAILADYLATHEPGPEGLIFHDRGKPLREDDDSADWSSALGAAELPKVGIHSARHTTNTILTELGVPVDVRQAILGHASRAVNEAIYTHTSDERVAQAMLELGNALDWR